MVRQEHPATSSFRFQHLLAAGQQARRFHEVETHFTNRYFTVHKTMEIGQQEQVVSTLRAPLQGWRRIGYPDPCISLRGTLLRMSQFLSRAVPSTYRERTRCLSIETTHSIRRITVAIVNKRWIPTPQREAVRYNILSPSFLLLINIVIDSSFHFFIHPSIPSLAFT